MGDDICDEENEEGERLSLIVAPLLKNLGSVDIFLSAIRKAMKY